MLALFLIGLPGLLYALVATHVGESWRRAAAPLAVGVALAALDLAGAPMLRRRVGTVPLGRVGRILFAVALGALLGLLWGVVAGESLEITALAGVSYGTFVVVVGEIWRAVVKRRQAVRAKSEPDSSDSAA
jgi:hypothetical protein